MNEQASAGTGAAPEVNEIDEAVAKLHAGEHMVYIATTGAVGHLIHELWRVPGSSNTIIGNELLYHQSQVERFIHFLPDRFVSKDVALRLAAEAHARARREVEKMEGSRRPVIGLGMTATVATDRPKHGQHRVHIAARSDGAFHYLSAVLKKGYRNRMEEGILCDRLALSVLLKAAGIDKPSVPGNGLRILDEVEFDPAGLGPHGPGTWHTNDVIIWPGDKIQHYNENPSENSDLRTDTHLIYPGSFDPLHGGHEAVADLAEQMTGLRVVFQMSGYHPVKGKIPTEEIMRRAAQFSHRKPVLLIRRAGLYIHKARHLRGFPFLLGVDAVMGLLDPKYYGGPMGLLEMLADFDRLGTRFYVVGRKVKGRFMTLDDVPIPQRFVHLFRAVSGRWDISSTELRKKG